MGPSEPSGHGSFLVAVAIPCAEDCWLEHGQCLGAGHRALSHLSCLTVGLSSLPKEDI